MKQKKVLAACGPFVVLLALSFGSVFAQKTTQSTLTSADAFILKEQERVVFLGNSIFENDFQFGYLELALTTRYAGRNITFRNLGWTGDNVWGEARSTFTNPPTPYQHLMNQLNKAQPTLVFVAYGGVEAQEGESGLPRFREGLTKLLDHLDSLGATSILLSPTPVQYADSSANVSGRNADLRRYAAEISATAKTRGLRYVDILTPLTEISKSQSILENGVHLNELGYYHLAGILEKNLGLTPRSQSVSLQMKKNGVKAPASVQILESEPNSIIRFAMEPGYLPLPAPQSGQLPDGMLPTLAISGLRKGVYALTVNNQLVATATSHAWEKGISITEGPAFVQAAAIREMIIKKNEQFFFQYRPLNRTYILGFRAYEQGRHAQGLEEHSLIIKWLEGQIALKSLPKSNVYQLSLVK
ncbi:GDSL-type esterase/lipase family protein [Arundinibacter roseus]|uniref:GDSL family lipase n=1 Tax=Arundinibacter roseus TaxID=2070510 RepID=A0A4R4KH25_9BACT|nr:GDSL-type esterase/lipase family protein [Arundinibacter roseus]TDB67360.1 GDSL family lipase [Arundinibacter roseus]